MKKIKIDKLYIYFCFVLIFSNSIAQNTEINLSSAQSRILFCGIENPIYINNSCGEIPDLSKINLTASAGTIVKVNGKWMITISKEWIDKIITIQVIDSSVIPKTLSENIFIVKQLHSPVAALNKNFTRCIYSKLQLLEFKKLLCVTEDYDFIESDFKITSFELIFVDSKNFKQSL